MNVTTHARHLFLVCIVLASAGVMLPAQTIDPAKPAQDDPLTRPRKDQKPPKLEKAYQKWLEDDVRDIITPEEEAAFRKLSNSAERDNFIEQFWLRRDPTPDTVENEFKEEHYRRIEYANEHFASGIPG
ncbi:MAG TPA: GWxTD domain-containing protein, partial [Candidatus Angelobacter sp.]|nr:GWxTD domain-containing protein [Candidatus Angelobacter sp.]